MKKLLVVLLSLVFLSSCASISSVDLPENFVDRYEVLKVTTRDVIAPSTTTILIYDKNNKTLDKVEGSSGSSFVGQLAGPAATAFSGYRIGKGIADSGDDTVVNNDSSSNAIQGQVQGQVQGQLQKQGRK